MTYRIPFAVIAMATLLAACAETPAPQPAPSPAPAPPPAASRPAPAQPAPPPASGWEDRPYAQGDWRYVGAYAGGVATFAAAGGPVQFMVKCDAHSRRVSLMRPGMLDPGKSARMIIRTSNGSGQWPVGNLGGTPPMVGIALAASDPVLDRIAFSRGRWAVETEGDPVPQILPAWPEIARVIEDCRG